MSSLHRDITTTGIILHKTPFQETSEIIEILTADKGKITAVVKGVKRKNSKLQGLIDVMNELQLELYKNPGSDWHILKSAELINAHAFNIKIQSSLLIQAAIEIFRQLELSLEDWKNIYLLFGKYIEYIKTVNINPIAIFWRFLLNMYKQLGIELNLKKCAICQKQNIKAAAFSLNQHGLICRNCLSSVRADSLLKVSASTSKIFSIIGSIGNFLDQIDLNDATIREINQIFLLHLSDHFHKKFSWKSLEFYSQLKS